MKPLLSLVMLFTLAFSVTLYGATITQYHTIKKGETLSSIATKYNVNVEDLKNWNNIKSSKIVPGQRIVVKQYQSKNTDHKNVNQSYYIVMKGDTLSEISKKTDVPVEKLKEYNNISGNSIYPGQKIRIVPQEQKTAAVKKSESKTGSITSDTYIVKKGDTLSLISKKTGISVDELKKINNLKNSKLLVGQKIALRNNDIPVSVETQQIIASTDNNQEKLDENQDNVSSNKIYINRYHTIKKGETLSKIANKYGTTVSSIKRLNNMKSNTIHPGKTIIVAKIVKDVAPPIVNPTPIVSVTPKVYYRVKFGDSIESIAAKFGISVSALKESNLLSDGKIKLGQTLVIPEVANKSEETNLETSISTQNDTYDTTKFLALKVIENAMNFINTPYRYGGLSQNGIDCSGLVKKSYEAVGISIPRTSREQAKKGEIIPISAMKPGDVIFFGNKGVVNHVGIYIGDNKFVHASREFGKVVVADLNDKYYQNHLICARTFINGDTVDIELTNKEN
ncbi:MAG TPA: LysM peptidoglycan-binding domain-containing protein [bacterium]|uniref:D-gamma-glutamyl-meso-diaminopimelic acid endopeptidase CwlS n=1 Tax=candidate division TA06 bacterium ADurb.Bin131 TaxID=1852827 RepID=A0A1V6C403_UNCT6|nr:MAG: D-gamma-glutamyl-meso-diaminopimelic acid endopeptidase CwlS precursor [candidate division TA06 bacterium ADurb.Bin131]HON05620.1 LysM peptidoglycan-binding domain-containing protein [bacterium]HOQ82152.1 LysM peptidoglycan-binding domain-containing protein [bacterium]HPC29970.1 LysM peptidoglycan-binding domain-containing protein [bacterium]HRV04763.1 LysM peptidoglycan-binding domain-containing protein [Candidatus Ratteibacteria bacterium]